ncbi:hypothetical protein F183_A36960 [Bryobacterales bacterium F-183]|nr:hypothetical protein F183_A36960 [Bryobacterales bacterium F-183]
MRGVALLILACLIWLPAFAADEPLGMDLSAIPSRFPVLDQFSWEVKPTGGRPPYQFHLAGEIPTDAGLNGNRLEGRFLRARSVELTFWVQDQAGTINFVSKTVEVYSNVPMSPGRLQFMGLAAGGSNQQKLLVNSIPSGQLVVLAPLGDFVSLSRPLVLTPAVVTATLVGQVSEPSKNYGGSGSIVGAGLTGKGIVETLWLYFAPPPGGFEEPKEKTVPGPAAAAIVTKSLVASLPYVEFVAGANSPAASKEVTVKAMRQGVTLATAVDQPWLAVTPSEAAFPMGGQVGQSILTKITVDPSGLEVGRHDGTVRFYDQSGQAIAETVVQLRIVDGKLPMSVDVKSLHFEPSTAQRTIRLRNANAKPVHFDLRIDEEHFQASVTEGFVPPNDELAIHVTAAANDTAAWRHANLVVAFDDAELDLITLSQGPAASACEAAPAHVFFESPGEHTAVYRGGIVDIRAAVRDGCGRTLASGNLFLMDSKGTPVFLHRLADDTWVGSWKVEEESTGNHRLDAFWVDGATGRKSTAWMQVTVRP